ncbi:MAG: hypothetical protein HRT86_15025 [Ilumatobacteraceae bacterium]|nr:hypothetical protein [Ilumatobacteraceae bacterium]
MDALTCTPLRRRWFAPTAAVMIVGPMLAALAWYVADNELANDSTCGDTNGHMSCTFTARDVAILVSAFAVLAAMATCLVGWLGRHRPAQRPGWIVFFGWLALSLSYIVLAVPA